MKSKLIILIIISLIILISVLINGIFLLKKNIKQNEIIIGIIKDFNLKTPVVTGDKYQ